MRIRRLYGLNRDIRGGNDICGIAENQRKNEKSEIPAISVVSPGAIWKISENALISALRRRLKRRGVRIKLRLDRRQPKSPRFPALAVSRRPENAPIRDSGLQTGPWSRENRSLSKISAGRISEAQRRLRANLAASRRSGGDRIKGGFRAWELTTT